MFRTFINVSHNYSLLMQFTTYVVHTVDVVELVMVELVSDSSKQWSLILIIFGLNSSEPMSTKTIKHMLLERLVDTSISSTLVQPDIGIFKRKDAIIWQLYSHRFVSSYDFVEDFRKSATVVPSSAIWLIMEGELGAEIDFVSDNVDHNQITISCNTSCNRGDGCMHSCSDTSRQDPYMQTSCYKQEGFYESVDEQPT